MRGLRSGFVGIRFEELEVRRQWIWVARIRGPLGVGVVGALGSQIWGSKELSMVWEPVIQAWQ